MPDTDTRLMLEGTETSSMDDQERVAKGVHTSRMNGSDKLHDSSSTMNGSATKSAERASTEWQEALPPWHTSTLIGLLLTVFVLQIPDAFKSTDLVANRETFSQVNFPDLLTVRQVAAIRLLLGSVIAIDTIYAFFYGYWEQDSQYYRPYSRLTEVRGIPFRGFAYTGSLVSGAMTLSSFTMWAWAVEGITFIMSGLITFHLDCYPNDEPSIWLYRVVIIGWQISAPTSLLVSAIVKYVLWPMALEDGPGNNNADVFKHPGALLEHNWNVLSVLTEVALLGGLPIRHQDYIWAPLFGLVYVLYSYAMMGSWVSLEFGPQFIYPFLDTSMGWMTSVCLLALLGVLLLSFGIFFGLDYLITEMLQEDDFISHVAAVLLIGVCVCRFRD